ncbi:MAG: PKD domain-containing protein [bacterium]|nr:PKD domain-containing protein [bacterium]
MLHALYATSSYNFIYQAQVVDKCAAANDRANEINLTYVPTTYYDAGHRVLVGANYQALYISRINDAGARTVAPLNMITAIDWLGNNEVRVRVRIGNGVSVNEVPTVPAAPSGIAKGLINVSYDFTALSSDSDADDLYYQWDFGDGTITGWLGPFSEGTTMVQSYAWANVGTYDVLVRTKDSYEETTAWSPASSVTIGCCIIRGDFNHDSVRDITDLTSLVDFMFAGGAAAPCDEEANINGIGDLDITDLTFTVDFMFGGGAAPPDCP